MADMPDDSGLPPHLRELARGFGFSPSQGAALREFLHAVLVESESGPELDDDPELDMTGM